MLSNIDDNLTAFDWHCHGNYYRRKTAFLFLEWWVWHHFVTLQIELVLWKWTLCNIFHASYWFVMTMSVFEYHHNWINWEFLISYIHYTTLIPMYMYVQYVCINSYIIQIFCILWCRDNCRMMSETRPILQNVIVLLQNLLPRSLSLD